MEGFIVFDFVKQYRTAIVEMATWHKEGKLKFKEHVVEGPIDAFPAALRMLFTGGNTGKLVLKLTQ